MFHTEGEYRVAVLLTPNKIINLKRSIMSPSSLFKREFPWPYFQQALQDLLHVFLGK